MSNKSQDEPDEYEVIFDSSKSEFEQDTKIENSEVDVSGGDQQSAEFIDAELSASDDFIVDANPDAMDQDINDGDEGIFAPPRRELPKGKKSSSLMFAVSLLAFVGVGGFVYVTNPDILSKVTSNFENQDAVTLPNETIIAETPLSTSDETVAQTEVQSVVPDMQMTDGGVIKPDAIQDIPMDTAVPPTSPVEEGEVAIAPTVAATDAVPTTGVENLAVEQPVTMKVDTTDSAPSDAPVESAEVALPNAEVIPAQTDIITPSNDKEDVVAEVDNSKPSQEVSAQVVAVAPKEGTPPAAQLSSAKANSVVEDDKDPIIVPSKEEQKILDDVNLNKYFDSPSGKMLKEIPAPSMNPDKGGNQSIIIVNKKAKKVVSQPAKPMGGVTIETKSLDTQIISADRAVKLGRYEAAKKMYDELYALNPRDMQILSGRAILLQKMGLEDQAISAYEELLGLYPNNADATVNLTGLIRKQYPAVALSKLLDLHMKSPNNPVVTAQLGITYADSGNYDDAIRYLSDAAAVDAKNALHFYNLAVISEKATKIPQAVSYYEKALELDAIYGEGQNKIPREKIYDRLARIRGH